MCALLFFFSLTLLSSYYSTKQSVCWSWGYEADKEHSSGGPRRPFLTHLSVALSFPLPPLVPSLQPLQPHFPPIVRLFSLTFSDSATSYLFVPTIPSSPEMPASVPLTQTHPSALFRPFAISPSLCSHSPSLCWASVCLVKAVESLTSVDAYDFSQAPEGPRERVLCALKTWACKEGAGTLFSAPALLGRVFNQYRCTVLLPGERFGLGGRDYTRLDNKQSKAKQKCGNLG